MDARDSAWDEWDRIRGQHDPDPLEVLRAAARYKRYFDAVEHEAIAVARALGHTWEEIAESLGQSRQAVWQRDRRSYPPDAKQIARTCAVWQAIKADPDEWYRRTRPIRLRDR